MKENNVLSNEKAYKLVSDSMRKITKTTRKVLYDYVHEMYHVSLAEALVFLGSNSDESNRLLNDMPVQVRGSILSYAEKLKKTDESVLEEVEYILKTAQVSFISEYQNIEENIALNGDEIALDLLKKFKKEMPVYNDRLNSCIIKFDQLDKKIDDDLIRKLIQKIDSIDLVLALHGTSEEFKNTFLKKYPSEVERMLREDIEAVQHLSVEKRDEARIRIINAVLDLKYEDIVLED